MWRQTWTTKVKALTKNPDEINTIVIAIELGKFPYEVEALPCDEYDRLMAYYLWKNKEHEKQQKKSKRNRGR